MIVVRPAPWRGRNGALLQLGNWITPCAIGRNGMTCRKREGDGATPVGDLLILAGYVRADRIPFSQGSRKYRRIVDDLGWCDAPAHARYNRPVRLPFAASHEEMRRTDRQYDICLVLGWNYHPRTRNRGSAIFLHLSKPGGGGTAGCIALSPAAMRRVLTLDPVGRLVRITR
jgi:L,D-peptidoglycan transpeptidase YkuD (ErfK/YbiS/YcfS/YnhG family)